MRFTLTTLLLVLPLAAADIDFKERFADPATRTEALTTLVPGTRDWFFYHALLHQLAGRHERCQTVLRDWRAACDHTRVFNPATPEGLGTLENRAALLQYEKDPEQALETLSEMLGLEFDDVRPDARTEERLPTRLDQEAISPEAFEAAADRRTKGEPWREATDAGMLANLADPDALSVEQRRWLLNKLRFAHHPAIVPLVASDLGSRGAKPFGKHKVHRLLSSGQLDQLRRLKPELVHNESFVHWYIEKLRPGSETDFDLDRAAHAAHLARCRDFALTLPPAFNSLKAHILHHHLRLQRELGRFPKKDFLAYLALPRKNHPILGNREPEDRTPCVETGKDYRSLTGCRPLPGDEWLIHTLLEHFLARAESAREFIAYIPEQHLARIHARARLLAGGDPDTWGKHLDPATFSSLQQETVIEFAPGQQRFFAADAPVALSLDLKHTPTLLVRIHELDPPAYVARHGTEPPLNLELGGLVPHSERTLRFEHSRLLRHRETVKLPELKGRGAWIVEFISRGVASRALVRKGRLVPHVTPAADGAVVRVFDEKGSPVSGANIGIGSNNLTTDNNGRVIIPDSMLRSPRRAVVSAPGVAPGSPGLAVPLALPGMPADDVELEAGFHIDRESLAAGRSASLRVETRLSRHGHPIPLDRLRNATLTLTARLLGDATVERVIGGDLKLKESFQVTFHVPADARSLTLRLAGKFQTEPGTEPIELSDKHIFEINGILESSRIAAAFFTPTPDGHMLEVRGRNGEPVPGRAVTLAFVHREFEEELKLRLRTDAMGRIRLGPMKDIDYLETASDWLEPALYDPAFQLRTSWLPGKLHIAAGKELRLPLGMPLAALDPARHSLIEHLGDPKSPVRDHFSNLEPAGEMLVVKPLPPGSYQLKLDSDTCRIEVSGGRLRGDLLVAPSRILPHHLPAMPRIVSARAENDELVVKLAGHGPDTWVAIIGTTFSQEWPAFYQLNNFGPPTPPTVVPGYTTCGYQVGRTLDEETRYILERRSAKPFPGSLLPRPGLLVNRFTDEAIEGSILPPLPGKDAEREEGRKRDAASDDEPGSGDSDTADSSHPSIDFLAQAPVIRYDLKPAADGTVRVPLEEFGNCRIASAVALDGYEFFQATVPLNTAEPKLRDRRLGRPLDSEKHHIGTRRTAVLAAGAEAVVENVLDAEWRAFTTLADVHAYLYGANQEQILSDFAFLTGWPKFDRNRKLALLAEHGCHELHLFLARKDPEFFARFVKPNLAEKREPKFIDDYLLGRDLKPYLRPYAWGRLNAAEKALLGQALPEAKNRVLTDLQHRWEYESPTPDWETQLFTQTLRGTDLAIREVLGLDFGASMPLDTDGASYLMQKLRSIVIPVVDFENTTVEEAIDFLRQRSVELDTLELDPTRKGMNFMLRKPRSGGSVVSDPGSTRIDELKLKNVPLATVLQYVCDSAQLRYKVDDFAVTLLPASETSEDLVTRTFSVPPDFIGGLAGGDAGGEVDPFAPDSGSSTLSSRRSVMDLLKDKGVPFPPGATAVFNPASSSLIIRNTGTNVDLIDALVECARCGPPSSDSNIPRTPGFAPSDDDKLIGHPGSVDGGMDPFAPAEPASGGYAPLRLSNSTFGSGLPLRSSVQTQPGPTYVWREHNYYEHRGATGESLVPLNRFWIDLAAWDGRGRFLSPHFNACTSSPNEALLCLALLDLPFEAPQPEIEVDGRSLRVRAKKPLLLFFKDTRQIDRVADDAPLLVRQSFHRHDDRFRRVEGRRVENSVDGGFITGVPYTTSLVVTNPTGSGRRIDVLAQIPGGAIPLDGKLPTLSETHEIQPYGVLSLETAFYFPAAGRFPVYPLQVAEDGTILAHADPRTLEVSAKPAAADRKSWPAVARDGSPGEVLARLRSDNLKPLELYHIRWRLRDREFFTKATGILRERLHFDPYLSAYGFFHNDLPAIRDYMENSEAVEQLGGWLDSPLLEIRPTVHRNWETLEFDPLVNPRRHRFADKPRITHEEAAEHYEELLDQLAWKPGLDANDQLVLTWFLLLQDRVEEALDRFAKIGKKKLSGSLVYDYLHCCILFYQAKPDEAREIATRYGEHPLSLWRERFDTVVKQADEIAAAAKPGRRAAEVPGKAAPLLELSPAPDGSLRLRHKRIEKATLRLYGVDLEHLFSANPFLDEQGGLHSAVRPNHVMELALDPAVESTRVELPPAFRRGNVLVTARSERTNTVRILDSRALELRRDPAERTIQVLKTSDGTAVPRCYVKIYAEINGGDAELYKDGYTDLRGKFDYLAHSVLKPSDLKRLAILVSHPKLGSRTEVIVP